MCKIDNMICLLFLFSLSWSDIRKRKVSIRVLTIAGVFVSLYYVTDDTMDMIRLAGGAVPGILFLLMSKVTEEGIGYGDSLGILILGIYLGFWRIISVLLCAFFLLFCTLIPLLCKKKMSRKAGLAFYPFLAGGYLWILILGG